MKTPRKTPQTTDASQKQPATNDSVPPQANSARIFDLQAFLNQEYQDEANFNNSRASGASLLNHFVVSGSLPDNSTLQLQRTNSNISQSERKAGGTKP